MAGTANISAITIRQARSDDEEAIGDICLRTSDAGGDGSHLYSDAQYPGLIWAIPYLRFCPEHAFVAVIDHRVVGYCLATADTVAFEQKLDREWWPILSNRIAGHPSSLPADQGIFDHIRRPERTPNWIADRYPAHLHINLLSVAQGEGNGGRLLEHQLHSLHKAGATGVHLGINQHNTRVMPFYEKHGFAELARSPSIIMGREIE